MEVDPSASTQFWPVHVWECVKIWPCWGEPLGDVGRLRWWFLHKLGVKRDLNKPRPDMQRLSDNSHVSSIRPRKILTHSHLSPVDADCSLNEGAVSALRRVSTNSLDEWPLPDWFERKLALLLVTFVAWIKQIDYIYILYIIYICRFNRWFGFGCCSVDLNGKTIPLISQLIPFFICHMSGSTTIETAVLPSVLLADRWPLCPVWCLHIPQRCGMAPSLQLVGRSQPQVANSSQFDGHSLISWQLVWLSSASNWLSQTLSDLSGYLRLGEATIRGEINATLLHVSSMSKSSNHPTLLKFSPAGNKLRFRQSSPLNQTGPNRMGYTHTYIYTYIYIHIYIYILIYIYICM